MFSFHSQGLRAWDVEVRCLGFSVQGPEYAPGPGDEDLRDVWDVRVFSGFWR